MTLFVVGINHKTAPIALRERATFAADNLPSALTNLLMLPMVESAVILSTCNRTELYLSLVSRQNAYTCLVDWLCDYHHIARNELQPSLYWYYDCDVVTHLMRVASGLDSQVLGEPQIFGQVKRAFMYAKQRHKLSRVLEHLFQKSFSVVKQVRAKTEIGTHAVSVAYATCQLAQKIFESLDTVSVLLIGAGEMIELAAYHLHAKRVQRLMLTNRTRHHVQQLAERVNAQLINFTEIQARLPEADIVITSTASMLPIIGKGAIERALKARRNRPMLLIDIAVPRDIEPEVAKLDHIYLYGIDDLQTIISNNLSYRLKAVSAAEQIIQRGSDDFSSWLRAQDAADTIRSYRAQAEQTRLDVEERALFALEQGADARQVLQELARRLTNRLIHAPTKSLAQAAQDGDGQRMQILRDSLGLD